jgi:hypothetical protein
VDVALGSFLHNAIFLASPRTKMATSSRREKAASAVERHLLYDRMITTIQSIMPLINQLN